MTDNKTATERLREMLDARGVRYEKSEDDVTVYYDEGKRYTYSANPESGWAQLFGYHLTPEQAIAATLWSDASAVRLAKKLRGIADEMRNVGASSMKPHDLLACYAAEVDKVAYLMKYAATLGNGACRNEWAEFGKFRCSECWTQVDAISTNTTRSMPIRYCPNCGRRVAR